MATPFPFGSGNVLTAAQMNAITTLPVSTKTASYTLTVADLGTRVVMNSASATTITVNTSIFGASDKVEILNIGAGVCTVTAGTCTVGTTGTLALVQNAGGTLTFISASASVFTASGVTASAGGFVRVGGGSLSGAATTFSSVFSATYHAYQIVLSNLVGSTDLSLVLTLGSTTTGYYGGFIGVGNDGTVSGYGLSNGSSINRGIYATANGGAVNLNLINPFLTSRTFFNLSSRNTNTAGGADGANGNGFVDNATSYTAFTLTTSTGTCTGTCNIYGLSLS